MAPNCLFFPASHWFSARTGQLRSACDPQKKKTAYRWIDFFLRSTGCSRRKPGRWRCRCRPPALQMIRPAGAKKEDALVQTLRAYRRSKP